MQRKFLTMQWAYQLALHWARASCRVLLWALLLSSTCTLTAYATGPRTAFHSFSFDAEFDGWEKDTDLLLYNYGNDYPIVRKDLSDPNYALYAMGLDTLRKQGGVHGEFPVGEFLEVKWRVRSTGKVYHEKVDLRPLLPADLDSCTVTFVIEGAQLYVYLATAVKHPDSSHRRHKTFLSRFTVTYELFPHNEFVNHR